ncbi:hypothetical protein [Kingella negevensis]|uniref:hypothetical protein n=1 Tax=Kingella negevensis TaxID=1522312 RepID=UPI001427BAFC|nr:hypothetical protein [Kingella negevensis]
MGGFMESVGVAIFNGTVLYYAIMGLFESGIDGLFVGIFKGVGWGGVYGVSAVVFLGTFMLLYTIYQGVRGLFK